MKRLTIIFSVIVLTFFSLNIFGQASISQIDSSIIRKGIKYLASDELEGRNTPSKGLEKAATYIISSFEKLGLQKPGKSYRQGLGLERKNLGKDNRYCLINGQNRIELEIKKDYVPFQMTGDTQVIAPLVFAGYGISAPALSYDDYENLDVHNKIVVILTGFPSEKDSATLGDLKNKKYSSIKAKVKTAIEKGAAGIIVLTNPVNNLLLRPRGYPWPSLSKLIPNSFIQMSMSDTSINTIPVIHGGPETMKALFGSVDALKEIQLKIDQNSKPNSYFLEPWQAELKTSIDTERCKADNIIAYIEGNDSILKNEYIILGAHYDHVGMKTDKDTLADHIFNGADDNASGTAAVLAIAEAYKRYGIKPARTVIFMLFAGEELGLIGSTAYVAHPLFPLKQTRLMLNLDMISLGTNDSLYVNGAYDYPWLKKNLDENNKKINLVLITDNKKLIGGSDHMSFSGKEIPAVHFFTGLHKHYHQVSDEADLTDTYKASRVAELVFLTSIHFANLKTFDN
ncbi:MAG: M20/M25/M40 family metallo-hydrolase [Bacteroidales bacterium]|jgi:hypothetical protein|nr:M20/M25/M40 family metallo-hydrolase [Bacteroidales bacterium]